MHAPKVHLNLFQTDVIHTEYFNKFYYSKCKVLKTLKMDIYKLLIYRSYKAILTYRTLPTIFSPAACSLKIEHSTKNSSKVIL